jgi:hypothetical protein
VIQSNFPAPAWLDLKTFAPQPYFQGLAWLNKGETPDQVAQAGGFFDRALAAYPDNVDALVGSARADQLKRALSFATDPIAVFERAEAKLTKALSSVPDHALGGHMVLGLVDIFIDSQIFSRTCSLSRRCPPCSSLRRKSPSGPAPPGSGRGLFVSP